MPAPFGPDLDALVARQGAPLETWERVATQRAARPARDTFRLTFADGTVRKGRVLDGAETARRVEAIVARLDAGRFPRVLDREGGALLEEWVPGTTLAAPAPAHARWAGETLRAVHGTAPPDLPPVRPDPGADLAWLAAEGALDDAAARALAARAGDPPPPAPPVIVHRDLCPENIVVRPDGVLFVVDNAAARVGDAAEDLARTLYRWPMTAHDEAALLDAYGDTDAFLRHRAWWTVAVLARAARVRRTRGYADADAPLRLLLAEAR